ncbi:MAG: hypothetical protein Q7I97_03010 [Thermovirgaceae bacterium]|nr:hypothetical protein [Thermovirgaceae bacterium]
MSARVEIRRSLEFGWRIFRENVLFFLVLMFIFGIPAAIMNVMVQGLPWASVSVMFLRGVSWLWRVIALMTVIFVSLSFRDKSSFNFRQTDGLYPLFIPYLLGSLLFSVIVAVGMVLLVAPGVYFAVKLQFMPYLIIDRGMEPVEALKGSFEMTRGFWLELFLFLLCIVGINFLGAIAFGLGLLVTIPVTFLAHAWVYRSFVPSEA